MKIAPSMLSADFTGLLTEIKEMEQLGADYLHIDIMDGNFVQNISFGPMVYQWLRPHTELVFDVHMMVQQPERYIESVAQAGADIISVHVEATNHLYRVIQQIHQLGKRAGVVINPGTSVAQLEAVLSEVELVLVMTVNPGFGGQTFIESTVEKIAQLAAIRKEKGYQFEIEVDGGINHETGKRCVAAGADVLVAGSYLFNADNRLQAMQALRQIEA
ncbi:MULTISPECIES: ribulose-phosphate 3-epimerase [unclassified Facklamia]|uniref:ribulose-phosphate 3-epimerase n=1 Tax=Aerococcaceae TaxID=186827 RepID=UPI0013B71B61|nr:MULTISPECIES: ribulose-phosphate 3-epimerase [unclassified Facklamia]NEW64082.1 ribulose-phosphate 3-epimerase [Facklamia sp. 252]NEW67540.1 ribulose-phosphate 3-epimerase [Facklamia sp. 253]QQD65790.1 ribulose-phosphate 3-epimerase [Aerococcaceae bacterium zg-252]